MQPGCRGWMETGLQLLVLVWRTRVTLALEGSRGRCWAGVWTSWIGWESQTVMSGHNKTGSKISSSSVPRVPLCPGIHLLPTCWPSRRWWKEDRRGLPLRFILSFVWLSVNAESRIGVCWPTSVGDRAADLMFLCLSLAAWEEAGVELASTESLQGLCL